MIFAALATAALLQAADPAPAEAVPAPTQTTAAAPASPLADTPNGAPIEDYDFVAWCRGALTGHMELYKAVKPEMDRVAKEKAAQQDAKLTGAALAAAKAKHAKEQAQNDADDAAQLKAGREYIVLYGQALDAAEGSSPDNLHARGERAIAEGYRIWAAARAANDRDKMWSWLMWELPGRCETASKRLKGESGLFADAYSATKARGPQGDVPASTPEAAPAAPPAAADPAVPAPSAAEPPAPALRPAEKTS